MTRFLLSTVLLFTLLSARSQSITVTAPNGGEVMYACQTYLIKWNAAGTSNFYDIDYSLNNGSTWASVASNLNVTNGQFAWTVPNAESNTCLIRVRDKNDIAKVDISDAVFTIHIPVTVTSPNGGESWQGGSSHIITWDIQGSSLTFNLDYSTDGGSTWTAITTNLSTSVGTYNWTVPNVPSTNCLVRVRDAVTNCMQDQSNAAFTITPAQPILTYPNGGETFQWDQPVTVTWNAATFYSPVRLEYSIDNGTTWTLITASATNNGSYSYWTVPRNTGTQVLVKASNSANVSSNDVSNAVFAIGRPLTVIVPNGGESLLGCNIFNVQITKTPYTSSGNISFEYSTDGGTSWGNITTVSNTSSSSMSYNWTIPNTINSTQCLVRAYNTSIAGMSDTSNAVFTIQPNNVVTVTSPNGGEVLPALSNYMITWANTAGASGLYNVEYFNGTSWTTLATGISGNSYNWTNIPNVPSTGYLVRVSDNANTCRFDQSNATFTVTAAQPILTYPNGGETFQWDQPVTVTWNAATFYSNVRLEYSLDNGTTWTLITASATNNGSYSYWTVPRNTGTQVLIKASNSANVLSNDVSNAVSSIGRPLIVTVPNGGESLLGCNNFTVQITKTPYTSSGNISFEYSTDGGTSWGSITTVSNTSSASMSYNWTIPNNISSTQCIVRAYNTSIAGMSDTSNAVFTIQPNNVVTVTSPNGGEVIPALSNYVITWTNTAGASGLYNVEYYNGSFWTTLATAISGNTYNWTNIPNVPSTGYLVRVSDNANTCRFDQSNATFTVTAAQPILTYPNGGETFQWDQPVTVTWNTATFYSSVRLEYSLDNGITWQLITSSATNNGSYSYWTVPRNTGSQVLIKASNTANLSSNDVSNTVSSIGRPLIVVVPNGGESLLGCNNFNVQISKTPYTSSGNISFEYSTDGGTSWGNITTVSNTSSASMSYNWTIPNNINSTQCLVRAYNTSIAGMSDTCNASFTIQPNNVITVTAPNGGEVIPALSNYVITWTNTAGASGLYNVEYFNGSSWTTLATAISGNTYNWTNIPNVPSTGYLVRVSDNANTCRNDVSNATFTVTAAQPILTYPNGGETFQWDQPVTVTWNAATFYSNVRLEYSLDNGITWQLITSSATNNGSYSYWTVPRNTGTQVLIKASNTANLSSNDVSNAVSSIGRPLTVIVPNGGESLLGCNNISVQISKTPYTSSGNISFEYSTDGGTSWGNITTVSNTSSASMSYNWTIPNNINSTQCLVRSYNTSIAGMSDTSNALFTIQPNNVITVTSPNGGEVLPALSSYTITWTNTPGASGLYNVEYYNGSFWTTLATGISGNTYNWTNIPNVPSTGYLVRVSDNANTCRNDVSNATFTVTAAQPVLTYPNGGETFQWDQPVTVTWNAATFYSNVRLEYSLDSGITWQLITSSATNNGSYSYWTVPENTKTKVLVKASNTANLSSNDVSNAVFSIGRPLTVITPNGGESLLGCNNFNVLITKTPYTSSGNISFEYSTDGGNSWGNITTVSNTSSASMSYNWTIPNNINSTICLVRAYNTSIAGMSDTSNAIFTIQPNNVITVTSPNGGEIIPALSNYTITWTNTAGASGLYNVEYYNGSFWTTLATGISGNTYNWNNIPNVPSANYLVRVSDNANTCRNDVSNATFTVTAAQPLLTYPNGGEVLWSSSAANITWNTATFYSNVRLEYSLDNGTTWTVITTSTTNNGSYNWTIPNTSSATCLIKASNTSNISINDISNAVFTINPPVKITSPNGLDQIAACTQTSIAFAHSPAFTSFNIEYSLNNGTNWSTIATNQTFSGTTGSYNWSIPAVSSTQALVRVYPTGSSSLADRSDSIFTIRPSVTVILPNYGGVLQSGTTYQVKWNSDGISNLYDLAYSLSGTSGPWTNIVTAYNTSTNTYNWTVPATASENCYIRVRDNVNSCKEDISNFAFAIRTIPAPITITTPSIPDSVNGCQNYTINWTESGAPVGSYNIELSSDGGTTWSNIATNYATTGGSYNWIVPNINTDLGLIKVSSSSITTIYDISDQAFKIRSRSVLAKPDTIVCSGATLNLTATGGLGTFQWSPSTFLNNSSIANPVATGITSSVDYIVTSSNGACVLRDTARIIVQQVPSFNITADAVNLCGGQLVTFTGHVTNGGANPSFQWKLNGVNVGNNDSIYRSSTFNTNDSVHCILSYSPACFAPITSNKIGLFVNAKPYIGADTAVTVTCAGCTVNLNNLYNTSGYAYAAWNTTNPTAAPPGIYRLIVSQLNGCTCPDTDTAFVYVSAFIGTGKQVCAGGNATFTSDVNGTTYQWQENRGAGFVNLNEDAQHQGTHSSTLQLASIPSGYYGYQYRCLVNGGSYSTVNTLKISAYWTGTSNTDWENPSNWGCGSVPDVNTDVFIYGGKTNYPQVNCNRICRSIYAAPSTSLQVNANKMLVIKAGN